MYVGLGTHRLHLNCAGSGSPTVILEAGLGGTSLDWVRVQPAIARLTRVCSYDRAGYGWSESAPRRRTAAAITSELKQMLTYAGVSAPYIMVGHSFGGLIAQLFASRYPEITAGVVLVDSAHKLQFERFRAAGIDNVFSPPAGARFVISNYYQIHEGYPEATRPLAQSLAVHPAAVAALHEELRYMRTSVRQVAAAGGLPDVPLAVLARDKVQRRPSAHLERIDALWRRLQEDLAAGSPQGKLIVVRESGHHIHLDRPHAVIEAIEAMVRSGRELFDQ